MKKNKDSVANFSREEKPGFIDYRDMVPEFRPYLMFANANNYKKKINLETYNNFIQNIYFQKTLREIINNLEPKYQKINHKIK